MSNLLLLLLTTGCGTLVIDVKVDEGDSGSAPDTGGPDDTGGDADDTSTDTSAVLSGDWTPGVETTALPAGTVDEALMGLYLRDVNGDGNLDLLLGRWLLAEDQNFRAEIWLGDGRGEFASPAITAGAMSRANPSGPNLGDVNGDGEIDMITSWDYGFGVFLGNGRGGFADQQTFDMRWMYGQHAGAVDLDGDGKDDIVASGGNSSGVPVVEIHAFNDGSPSLVKDFGYLGTAGLYLQGAQVVPVTLDNTDKPAALWVDAQRTDDDDIAFQLDRDTGTGDIYPYYVEARLSGDGARAAAAGDLYGDGLEEVVTNGEDGFQVYDPAAHVVSVLHTDDDWNRPAAGVAIGDLNGDGEPDALEYGIGEIVRGKMLSRFAASLNKGGVLAAAEEHDLPFVSAAGIASSVQIADLNHDGCGDVAVISDGSAVTVILGDCSS